MNLLQRLALRRLFTGQPVDENPVKTRVGPETFAQPALINTPLNPPDTGLMRPRNTPHMKAYKEYLASEPLKGDYELSKLGKILAAGSGLATSWNQGAGAGISQAQGLMDRPYMEALGQHERKGGRLRELADLEYKGLKDEDELIKEAGKLELEKDKVAIDLMRANSTVKLNEEQMKNLASQVRTRGLSLEKNEVDGNLYVVNKEAGTRVPIGQFAESIGESDKRKRNMFSFETKTREESTRRINEDEQAHDKVMESIRNSNNRAAIKLRADLDLRNDRETTDASKISATQSNAAREGALSEILMETPSLRTEIFDTVDGKLVPKENINPDVYKMFIEAVRQRADQKMGVNPDTRVMEEFVNRGRHPLTPAAPKEVLDALAEIGITNPTPAQIEEAKKDLGIK